MSPSFRQIRLESLKQDKEKLKKDYEAVAEKKRRESNPVEKHNLQLQLDSILKEIEQIEQNIKSLEDEKKEDKIKELQKILSEFTTKEDIFIIKRAFKTCSGEGWVHLENNAVEEMLKKLNGMPKVDPEYSRVEEFVAYLSAELFNNSNSFLNPELIKWGDNNINKFNQLWQLKTREIVEERKNQKSYLLIVLEKSNQDSASNESEYYTVKAWFIPDIKNYKYYHKTRTCDGCEWLDCPDIYNKTFTINEIQTKVFKTFVDKSLEYGFKDLTIEIFLPLTLLNHNVEWWQIKEELNLGYDTFIGKDYKVVVRSYERCTKSYERLRVDWINKWEILSKKSQKNCVNSIYLEVDDETVGDKLINSAEEIIGIKVVKAPKKIGKGSIFAAIIKTALPLALWLRKNPHDLDYCQSEIKGILENCCIEQLPDAVRSKRKGARLDADTDIGHHISLLWEDPNRLPPGIN